MQARTATPRPRPNCPPCPPAPHLGLAQIGQLRLLALHGLRMCHHRLLQLCCLGIQRCLGLNLLG